MNYEQMRAHRRDNQFQALILILGMAMIMSLVGYALGGRQGVWLALLLSAVSALLSPTISPKLILRMYRARPIDPREAPELYQLFGEFPVVPAARAGPPVVASQRYMVPQSRARVRVGPRWHAGGLWY